MNKFELFDKSSCYNYSESFYDIFKICKFKMRQSKCLYILFLRCVSSVTLFRDFLSEFQTLEISKLLFKQTFLLIVPL